MIGMRATLEMLGIPVPSYATRKPPGRPPARAIADAFSTDERNGGNGWPVPAFLMHADRDAHLAKAKLAKAQARIAKRRNDNITG
jgi:hypothetical protein